MATAQTSADRPNVGQISNVDAGGFYYTSIGGIRFYTGQGVPNHVCPTGCVYVDTTAGKIYCCTVADGTWVEAT
tara:strand:- start:12683 stop:12904 length:222 start_codon:yes stop_codon:yes gene_type:complete